MWRTPCNARLLLYEITKNAPMFLNLCTFTKVEMIPGWLYSYGECTNQSIVLVGRLHWRVDCTHGSIVYVNWSRPEVDGDLGKRRIWIIVCTVCNHYTIWEGVETAGEAWRSKCFSTIGVAESISLSLSFLHSRVVWTVDVRECDLQ